MDNKIRVGIVGYGNLGKGVEMALLQNPDFELKSIFTRRDLGEICTDSKVTHISQISDYENKIDVMILCGGSAKDLPEQGPMIAKKFNTVDSFDNHGKIPEYFKSLDEVAKKSGHISLLSVGWDPGLFSLNRLLGQTVLPEGKDYTFWGKGVSQGHSDAIRRVKGVKKGIQYTIPIEDAVERVRTGENPELSVSERHERVCYIVPEKGANLKEIKNEIKNMPNYFAEYNTTVNIITEKQFEEEHGGMQHGGFVIRAGNTANRKKQLIEFSLKLGDNPGFTSSVLVAYARAAYRLSKDGRKGAYSVFDIPFSYLSMKNREELMKELL